MPLYHDYPPGGRLQPTPSWSPAGHGALSPSAAFTPAPFTPNTARAASMPPSPLSLSQHHGAPAPTLPTASSQHMVVNVGEGPDELVRAAAVHGPTYPTLPS